MAPETMTRMGKALSHRGPDQQNFYLNRNVGLAHSRLKIIDLSDAASQPMTDQGSRYFVVFNGEIYNFRELRKDLESKYTFFSNSDTEVILRCFQEYGDQSWNLLNGMFSIALFDSHTRELILARAPPGIKPLYYYQDEEKILFASELKALFASGLITPQIDINSLALYLQLGYFPRSRTPYRAIRKLEPGHLAKVNPRGLQISRFWSIRKFLPERSIEGISGHANLILERLLLTSVEHQMISDVPLGAFLSGGIDSSLIVALMSKLSSSPVKTFTVGFSNMGYYDERPYAARISRHFGTEHHEFAVENRVSEVLPQ